MKFPLFALLLTGVSLAFGQDASMSKIPDQFLISAVERLTETINRHNTSDLNAHSYFVMRASDRFEIIYGHERWKSIRPEISNLLSRAEEAATDKVVKEKIKSYHSSLFEGE